MARRESRAVKIAFLCSFACAALASSATAQNTSERRLQAALQEIDRLKSSLSDQKGARFRLNPKTQELKSALGLTTPAQTNRDHRDIAVEFIRSNRKLFFNPPETARAAAPAAFESNADSYINERLSFSLDREHLDSSQKNLLFKQVYNDIPVEFSRFSAHLTPANQIFAVFSNLDSGVAGVSPNPAINENQALSVVVQQWTKGRPLTGVRGELAYLPARFEEGLNPKITGRARLAWKFHFRLSNPLGLWNVYVDAHNGQLVGAVNDLRIGIGDCDTPTNSKACVAHFKKDPSDISWSTSSVRGLEVYEADTSGNITTLVTGNDGIWSPQTPGNAVFAVLRTTYAAVINDKGPNPSFLESGINTQTVSVSSSSANPYPAGSRLPQSFNCPANSILTSVGFLFFDVGFASNSSELEFQLDDSDFVEAFQPATGRRLAAYTGQNKGAFSTVISTGARLDLNLVSNSFDGSGNESGYQVTQVSCAVVASGGVNVSLTFQNESSSAATNVLKHLEEIQGYFTSGSSRYDLILATRPAVAHVNFGSQLANAFFDPESDALFFGEGGSANSNRNTALATDVIFHEYTHLVIDHIYNIANFGHDGALSEALADYFATDAFNNLFSPSPAKTTFGEWAFAASSRQLQQSTPKTYPANWTGEIHDDSLIVSGALWDLRNSVLGSTQTKNLVRDALFYFPDSFQSFYEALITTSAGRFNSTITSAFNSHGIGSWIISGADALEPNDGFETAGVTASGSPSKATIYPAGDVDFYRFVAGVGPVSITLKRPLDPTLLLYFGYGFQVFDVARTVLGEAMPSSVFLLPQGSPDPNSMVTDQAAGLTLNLTAPQVLYVAVSAPILENSNDRTNSQSLKYELIPQFNTPIGAVSASRVSASITDQRNIRFSANSLTGFDVDQSTEAVLDHIDVLDHALSKLADASGSNLTISASTSSAGRIEATASLPANFFVRYPAVGTIFIEVFVKNALGRIYSIGLSNPLKLSTDQSTLTAYNNIFNPARGQKATFKYSSSSAGRYRLAVYTANGDLVKILTDRFEESGMSTLNWDGKNGDGQMVASGVYLVHLEGPGVSKTQKAVVVK
ncbi:MAG: hypothetical protein HY401_08730 [Elusimicrobia bacterium]|nr:hypothetical protein [Elusimicrobiota bacterium]